MGFVLAKIENSTEGIQVEEVGKALEKMKEPGVVQHYLKGLVPDLLAFLFQLVIAALVYFVGTRIIKLIRKIIRKTLDKRETDEGVKQFLDSLSRVVCYFVLIMMILSLFGVATASAMAVLGSAGLTIGLALQGSLSNFAGGVLILMLKPFRVGDYIVEDTNKNEGTVAEISIFYTKLKSADNKIIVIPNGILANSSLTNVTDSDRRRIDWNIDVAYQTDLKEAKAVIRAVLEAEERRLPEEPVQVFVSELGESAITIGARLWVPMEDYWEIRWKLTEEIKNALDARQIEIPFPQLDVNVRK